MKGVLSCLVVVTCLSSASINAFTPLPSARVLSYQNVPSSTFFRSRDCGLFMAEYSVQGNTVEEVEETQLHPFASDEQGTTRWDANTFVNNALIFGVVGLVLAKLFFIDADVSRGWTAAEVIKHIPMSIWDSYMKVLTDSPIATKAVTSASVYTIGDVIAQQAEGTSAGELDRMRVLRSMLAGLIGHGPLSHLWYNVSDKLFEYLHWTAWWSFVPKVAVDQAIWGPIWNNTYILLLGIMKRESIGQIWEDIKRSTIPLMVSGLKLWPLAHTITYGLIPVENRLLWVDLVEIFWVTILATSAAGSQHGVPAGERKPTTIAEQDTSR